MGTLLDDVFYLTRARRCAAIFFSDAREADVSGDTCAAYVVALLAKVKAPCVCDSCDASTTEGESCE